MTCKNCVYLPVCDAFELNGISKISPSQCGYFKNKADVVEVVRCKDCRRAEWLDDIILDYKHYFCRFRNFCEVDENDYCSYGERRCEDA